MTDGRNGGEASSLGTDVTFKQKLEEICPGMQMETEASAWTMDVPQSGSLPRHRPPVLFTFIFLTLFVF